MRKAIVVIAMICLGLSGLSAAQSDSVTPRVRVWMPPVQVSPQDPLVRIPVYLANPFDTIAGVELNLEIEDNPFIEFVLDEINEEGLEMAVDTSGTLLGSWEWVGLNFSEPDFSRMKVAAMADWPDGTITPPLAPQDSTLLMSLVCHNYNIHPLTGTVEIHIAIQPEHTGFSDNMGRTIGVTTTIEKECERYVADSCVSWKNRRVGRLDTTIVKMVDGVISIVDSLPPSHE
ncbi:MAG: hypothetical protein R3F48_11765 [Candidatus Zixiibacteriota bacterium]